MGKILFLAKNIHTNENSYTWGVSVIIFSQMFTSRNYNNCFLFFIWNHKYKLHEEKRYSLLDSILINWIESIWKTEIQDLSNIKETYIRGWFDFIQIEI